LLAEELKSLRRLNLDVVNRLLSVTGAGKFYVRRRPGGLKSLLDGGGFGGATLAL